MQVAALGVVEVEVEQRVEAERQMVQELSQLQVGAAVVVREVGASAVLEVA